MTKRLDYVDIARGLAILYIIECHVCDYHVAWIDSWAMPIFFIIMGLFFKPTKTWKEMVVKKARTILLPFFLLSIPSYIQYVIQLGPIGLFYRIADPFNCCHGVGWFLICIFWCYLIYYTIHLKALIVDANGSSICKKNHIPILHTINIDFHYSSSDNNPSRFRSC